MRDSLSLRGALKRPRDGAGGRYNKPPMPPGEPLVIRQILGVVDTPAKSEFLSCALASALVTRSELDEAKALLGSQQTTQRSSSPPSDEELADMLVKLDRLNRWQADQLLAGRSRFSLGPYRILDSIGQGGIGQVFKVQHRAREYLVLSFAIITA